MLVQDRWFSPASFTTKTGRHDIAEILLKVALKRQQFKSIKSYTGTLFIVLFIQDLVLLRVQFKQVLLRVQFRQVLLRVQFRQVLLRVQFRQVLLRVQFRQALLRVQFRQVLLRVQFRQVSLYMYYDGKKKPLNCRKSQSNFITCCIEQISP